MPVTLIKRETPPSLAIAEATAGEVAAVLDGQDITPRHVDATGNITAEGDIEADSITAATTVDTNTINARTINARIPGDDDSLIRAINDANEVTAASLGVDGSGNGVCRVADTLGTVTIELDGEEGTVTSTAPSGDDVVQFAGKNHAGNTIFDVLDTGSGAGELRVYDGSVAKVTLNGGTGEVTSTKETTTTIELGHATDTTISRVSAGKIAVEGVNVVTTSSTDTLINKTIAGANNTLSVRVANDVTGLGSNIATALAVAVGTDGAPVIKGGALGTPASGVASNLTALNATQLTTGTIPQARYAAGVPIQIVYGNCGTASTSSAYAAGAGFVTTGLSATITCRSNTSKVIITVSTPYAKALVGDYMVTMLKKNGTNMHSFYTSYLGNALGDAGAWGFTIVDAPASGSALTYELFFASINGTNVDFLLPGYGAATQAFMVLTEIAQ